MSLVTGATVDLTVNGISGNQSISTPLIGSARAWNSVGDLVIDLFERVSDGEDLFNNSALLAGSDPTVGLSGIPGTSFNDVRSAMHITWAEAGQARRRNDPGWLQARFSSVFGRNGTRLVTTDQASGRGVFLATVSGPLSQARTFGNRNNGRTGVRNGSISFLNTSKGQTADIRKMLYERPEDFCKTLEEDKEWCFQVRTSSRAWKTLTPAQSVDAIRRCGCVLSGIWVRFSQGPLAASIVKGLMCQPRSEANGVGYKPPISVSRAKSQFLFKMAEVVAGSRGIDPMEYWNNHLGEPVVDTEIFALCKRFEIDLMVLQAGSFGDYVDMTDAEHPMALVSKKSEIEKYKHNMKDVRVMIRFNGRKKPAKKFDRREGSSMFMICSYLQDKHGHVDTIFDPNVEANILGKQYHKFICEMTYDLGENNRVDEGYFDRLLAEVVPNGFTPKRLYAGLECMDVEEFISPKQDRLPIYIDNKDDLKKVLFDKVPRAVAQLYQDVEVKKKKARRAQKEMKKKIAMRKRTVADMLYRQEEEEEEEEDEEDDEDDDDGQSVSSISRIERSFYGSLVYIDSAIIQDIAQDMFEMEENNIQGMVYYFGAVVNELERIGMADKIDQTSFKTTMNRARSAKIFNRQLQLSNDDNNRIDCMSSFDDLNEFAIRLAQPIKAIDAHDTPFSPKFIVRVGTYSKNLLKIGMAFVKEDWVQKMIDSKRWVLAAEYAKKDKEYDIMDEQQRKKLKGRHYDVLRQNHHITVDRLALSVSRKSIMLALLGQKKRGSDAISTINRVFGSYPPVRDEIVHMHDPQIDEPVVPVWKLEGDKVPRPHVGHWEMDANFFYTQTLLGVYNDMLSNDFYGDPWMNSSPRRAVVQDINYAGGDFLASYEADFGYAWIDGISFGQLRTHMGFNELHSWWRFADDNPARVERRVPSASVIHLTSYIVTELEKRKESYTAGVRPWLYEMSKQDKWSFIQQSVLNIKQVYFYHTPDTREAIRRFKQFKNDNPNSPINIDDRLNGIVVTESVRKANSVIGLGLRDAYTSMCDIIHKTDMFDTDRTGKKVHASIRDTSIRKAVKFDFNRSIGMMKNGRFIGSVSTRSDTDVINLTRAEGGKLDVYTFQGIPFPQESLVQVCTRELPSTDKVLSEMVFVTPVVLAGYPRALRIDILERARHVMDLFVIHSDAFMVKTDAVFFKDEHLDGVFEYVQGLFPYSFKDYEGIDATAQDIRDAREECREEACLPNKFCTEHSPFPVNERCIDDMIPVKFIWHPGLTVHDEHGPKVEYAVEDNIAQMYASKPDDLASDRKLSPDGREQLANSLVPLSAPIHVNASDLMPTFEEIAANNGLLMSPNQYIGEGPTIFVDRVEEHCWVCADNPVFLGEEGEAQPYTVDNSIRNKMYLENLMAKVDSFGDKGFLMEGPPGAGKSYFVCEYIKRGFVTEKNTVFFVATATHLTLAPYKQLDGYRPDAEDRGNSIQVSTIHSLIGVFNEMEEACANPDKWLNKRREKSFMSRFMRCIGSGSKAVIFIDEYEMLPLCMEEMILYLSTRPGTRVVLLGDKYQTAAHGRGIRCDGDVVKNVTNDIRIDFDLPFRNTNYEYVMAQRRACAGKPTLFLDPILADYTAIENRSNSVYTDEIERIARAYHTAAEQGVLYKDPVVSLQNYKAICVITLDIMKRVEALGNLGDIRPRPFCGATHCGMGEQSEGELGSIDVDTPSVESESYTQQTTGERIFVSRRNHKTGDPSSKAFLVGTKMWFQVGYSYRSITAFRPKLRGTAGTGKSKKPMSQQPVRMGQVMMFEGMGAFRHSKVKRHPRTNKQTRVHEVVPYGRFSIPTHSETDPKRFVFLLEAEIYARMYYPFCLYTEGVVGHTFDRYTMVKFSNKRAYSNDYQPLKRAIEDAEHVLGDKSWVAPVVKTMNVAVSRLTKGNKLRVIEINEGRQGFWRSTLENSKWHILGEYLHRSNDAYKLRLQKLRQDAVDASKVETAPCPLEEL